MAYDPLVESLRLLEGAPPASRAGVSRRTRYVPLAVDRADDIAATVFLRRGVNGVPELDVHALERIDGGWQVRGGGGGPADEGLGPRPPQGDRAAPGVSGGHGSTARTAAARPGRGGATGWVHWATVRAAEGVAVLLLGERRVPVADHGVVVVVWGHEPPSVTALDASGTVLGRIPLVARAFPDLVYRDGAQR